MRNFTPTSIEELRARNLSAQCPECHDTVTLNPIAGPVTGIENAYFVAACPNTRRRLCKPIFAVYQPLNDRIIELYPIPGFAAEHMDKSIPESIRGAYAEARRCGYANAYRAAVAMYRLVVEATACKKLGPDSQKANGRTKRLLDLIDEMHTQGLITKDLKETAHEIRHFGNYGVHVQEKGLDPVSEDECTAVRGITWHLIQALYVAPAQTAALKAKRKKRKKKPETSP